ncbi:MAG: hypothetical protein H6620_10700 [Halobacteriovoraceae bacterium]|nr:hypothetical protein [Halobacteriovoraceae bacterium]
MKKKEKNLQKRYQLSYSIIKRLEFDLSSLGEKVVVILVSTKRMKEDVAGFSNLFAFNKKNCLIWKGKLPRQYYETTSNPIHPSLVHFANSGLDSFIDIEKLSDPLKVRAFTFGTFIFDINVLTGEVTDLIFTK